MTFSAIIVLFVSSLHSRQKFFFTTKDTKYTKHSKKYLRNFVFSVVRGLNYFWFGLVRVRSVGLTVFAALLAVACTNIKLVDTQLNKALQGKSASDILVIMVTDDEELREPFEDGFVSQLNAIGVDAVSSTNVIGARGDRKLEKEMILKVVHEYQNDAVLISHLVDVEKHHESSSATADPGGFYGYYNYAYEYVHAPGLYSTHTRKFVRLESSLYDVEIQKSMWSGRAESNLWHPKSEKRVIDDMIKVLIKDLQRNELIP